VLLRTDRLVFWDGLGWVVLRLDASHGIGGGGGRANLDHGDAAATVRCRGMDSACVAAGTAMAQ